MGCQKQLEISVQKPSKNQKREENKFLKKINFFFKEQKVGGDSIR